MEEPKVQITIPLNIIIFFGVPFVYDVLLKHRSPVVWGIRTAGLRRSILGGLAVTFSMFPIVYVIFRVIFHFSTKEFVQPGTVAYYFYMHFSYPLNLIYYSIWTLFVIASGEELFFRGFIHNKLQQRLTFIQAALISSTTFTALHVISILLFPPAMMLPYLALCFITAFLWAYILNRTKNLTGCWLSHSISNILAAIFIGIL